MRIVTSILFLMLRADLAAHAQLPPEPSSGPSPLLSVDLGGLEIDTGD